MTSPIPINPVHLGGGGSVLNGAPPDPWAGLLQSLLQGAQMGSQGYIAQQDRNARTSASSAQLDLQKQEFAFRIAQEKTEQERVKHQQEVARQQGEATRLALETILPHMAATGGLNALLPQPQQPTPAFNPQGPAGQPLPAMQQTQANPLAPAQPPSADVRLTQFLASMEPEAAAQFVQHQLPHLLALRDENGGPKSQAVQTGDTVTTFVPGKGFWDAEANGGKGAYVPSIPRRISADEKESKALDRAIRLETLQTQRDYRTAIRAQTMTRMFDTRTKDLRERGRIIMQAQQTIGDAQNNPDPNQRRVLYSSAIANFVQAADQKAQLRIQLLNYFKQNVDPSIGGKWNTLKDRLTQGQLPAYVSQGMLTHLQNLLQMSRSEYEKHRAGEVKRHPELEHWLPDPDEFFTADHGAVPPGAPNLDALFSVPGRP